MIVDKNKIQSENRAIRRPVLGFVHIPKTAGTTVKFILRNSTFLRHCDLQPLVRDDVFTDADFRFMQKIFFFGLHSISGHSLIHPTAHLSAPVQYFTFVRDPLQRCLSHYQQMKRSRHRQGRDISFEEYMQIKDVYDHQVIRIAGEPDIEKAKHELSTRYMFVGLTERFAESMLVFQRLCPYPLNLAYKRLHVAKDNTAKKEVLDNPDSRHLLEQGNRLDVQLYHYVRDELYPALREKAGLAGREVDETEFSSSSYPLRYKLTRGYNNAIYKPLIRLRQWLAGRGQKVVK
jgi:hypothetical protein